MFFKDKRDEEIKKATKEICDFVILNAVNFSGEETMFVQMALQEEVSFGDRTGRGALFKKVYQDKDTFESVLESYIKNICRIRSRTWDLYYGDICGNKFPYLKKEEAKKELEKEYFNQYLKFAGTTYGGLALLVLIFLKLEIGLRSDRNYIKDLNRINLIHDNLKTYFGEQQIFGWGGLDNGTSKERLALMLRTKQLWYRF